MVVCCDGMIYVVILQAAMAAGFLIMALGFLMLWCVLMVCIMFMVSICKKRKGGAGVRLQLKRFLKRILFIVLVWCALMGLLFLWDPVFL